MNEEEEEEDCKVGDIDINSASSASRIFSAGVP